MELYREFFKIIEALNISGLPYAVVGGLAMAFHDVPRFTKDIDILGLPADMSAYSEVFKKLGYSVGGNPWTFKDSQLTMHRFIKPSEDEEFIVVDLLIGNLQEHRKMMDRVVLDDSYIGKVRLASREDLIALKKLRNSDQDQVDIKNLSNDQNRESSEGSE
jgi:hypothetical protein